jgi:hypothetical protein
VIGFTEIQPGTPGPAPPLVGPRPPVEALPGAGARGVVAGVLVVGVLVVGALGVLVAVLPAGAAVLALEVEPPELPLQPATASELARTVVHSPLLRFFATWHLTPDDRAVPDEFV